MLAELKEFFSELVDGQKPQHQFAENDYRRAAAALLVHVATLDGDLTDAKRNKLHAILETQYGLDAAATDELIAEATQDDREAVDFYHFTSLLMRTLDGELTDVKRHKLHAILETQYGLDPGATDELIEEATQDDREAVDFYHFTSLLMRALDEAGRLRIVEMLWEMVYADGVVSEFEANVMWRVADLLAVSARDRIALRERVAAAQGNP